MQRFKLLLYFYAFSFIISCTSQKASTNASGSIIANAIVDSVTKQYAPDARTALFKVVIKDKTVIGETNLPTAKQQLLQQLAASGINYVDSITVLPTSALDKQKAVVTVSVANLRTQGKHSAELATQAMLGTPIEVLKRENGWYLVQTPDKYIAWIDAGALTLMDNTAFTKWQQQDKVVYTATVGFAYATASKTAATVSDLVYGDVLTLVNKDNQFYKVKFPDGREAFVPATEGLLFKDWATGRQPSEQNLVNSSKQFMGLPYLWGGTSTKGVDCSGFTKMVYFMNGLVLPRDASQQVQIGEEVNTTNGWQQLKPGDLLFFGVPAKEGRPEKVVHVGMWLGQDEFIHASNYVRISSLNPAATNFDSYEFNRFLRAKRIYPEATLYDLRVKSFY